MSTGQHDVERTDPNARPRTQRALQKANRRAQLLAAAARLMGDRGFAAVTLEEIGREAGVSAQALYRHFSGKQDVLAALLLDVSQRLLDGGLDISRRYTDAGARIEALIEFHCEFALDSPEMIRLHEQELERLEETARRTVRRMQREYVQLWSAALDKDAPGLSENAQRTRVHAVFGLMNSAARSLPPAERADSQHDAAAEVKRNRHAVLVHMALSSVRHRHSRVPCDVGHR